MRGAQARADWFTPRGVDRLEAGTLLAATEAASVQDLWTRLSGRLYAIPIHGVTGSEYDRACPGDMDRIVEASRMALARRVDVLGIGPIDLGSPIDWHRDFKTGHTWPAAFMRDIHCTDLGRPNDVKVPWEISRLQWLIPAGQLYVLTHDERCARAVRAIFEEWIDQNPYGHGVNWTCTMEVAMRIMPWTWFFHVFAGSRSWSDEHFQTRFLRTLFLHGEFTARHLDRPDGDANRFTADAAGLVYAGLFFGRGASATRWAEEGWRHLCDELPRQVTNDGVARDASIPHHRLAFELFFLAGRFREACGLPVPDEYRDRLIDMARFTMAYTRPDGSTPLVGDANDARVLSFGSQAVGDHRYVPGLVGAHWTIPELLRGFSGPRSEVFWTLGRRAAASLPGDDDPRAASGSARFDHGGFYVMRNDRDHVFIDCGPVGQGGRGRHGHNDCLSFEAALDGVHLISDSGSYLNPSSAVERNRFRSTACHNTPQVDHEELNRFTRWDYLRSVHGGAKPELRAWTTACDRDEFVGTHSGYERLKNPVRPVRTIVLEHATHSLRIEDVLEGAGDHLVTIPLHLSPGVEAVSDGAGRVVLRAGDRVFELLWSSPDEWSLEIGCGRVSPRYGVARSCVRLLWLRSGPVPATLSVRISAGGRRSAASGSPARSTQ